MKKLRAEVFLPFLWLFLGSSRGVYFWIPSSAMLETDDYLAGNPLERIVFIALMALATLLILTNVGRRREFKRAARNNWYLLFFFGFMFLSIVFSQFPLVSLKRFVKTSGTLLMALLIWTSDNPRKTIVDLFDVFLSVTMLMSVVFIHLLPDLGTVRDWTGYVSWVGITYQKNGLGSMAAFAFVFFFWTFQYKEMGVSRVRSLVMLILSLYLLVGSHSATSLAVLPIGILIIMGQIVIRRTKTQNAAATVILWLAALCFGALILRIMVGKPIPEFVVAGLGKDMTFTGRTELWMYVLQYAIRRPLLGYGYGGFWIGDLGNDLWSTFLWHPNQAHNGYIDVFIQLGLVGLILFFAVIVVAGKRVAGALRRDQGIGALFLALYVICIVTNFFESTFIRLNAMYWFVFLLVASYPSYRPEKAGEKPFDAIPEPAQGPVSTALNGSSSS